MKTLFLMEENCLDSPGTLFFELEGDYSHLDAVSTNNYTHFFYNGSREEYQIAQNELLRILYGKGADIKYKLIVDVLEYPTKDWDYFVRVWI